MLSLRVWLQVLLVSFCGCSVSELETFNRRIRSIGKEGSWEAFAKWFDGKLQPAIEKQEDMAASLFQTLSASENFLLDGSSNVRSLRMLREIPNSSLMMLVPCEASLSLDQVVQSPYAAVLLKALEAKPSVYSPIQLLVLQITWEVLHLDSSHYKEYLELLPPVGPGVTPFGDIVRSSKAARASGNVAEAEKLEAVVKLSERLGRLGLEDEEKIKNTVELATLCLIPTLLRESFGDDELDDLDEASPSDLRAGLANIIGALVYWASDLVRSRAWLGRGCNDNSDSQFSDLMDKLDPHTVEFPHVLMPLADLMNHNTQVGSESQSWFQQGRHVGWAFLNIGDPINMNAEIFSNYEGGFKRCNADQLLHFGYTEPDPARDCFSIRLIDAKSQQIEVVMRDGALLPERILDSLRLQTSQSVEKTCGAASGALTGRPLSLLTELKALHALRRIFHIKLREAKQRLETFGYSKAVPAAHHSAAVQGALICAQGERRILADAIREIEKQWLSYLIAEDPEKAWPGLTTQSLSNIEPNGACAVHDVYSHSVPGQLDPDDIVAAS